MRYWQPLGAKTTATHSLPHSENECQQFLVLHCWKSKNRAHIRAYNKTIDRLDRQQFNKSKEKHGFQSNRYRKLQNLQKQIIGCWICDFDKILLSNCNNKSIMWIYRWTRWATRSQPGQFRQVGWTPLNHTLVDCSGVLITQTANLPTVQFGPWPGP